MGSWNPAADLMLYFILFTYKAQFIHDAINNITSMVSVAASFSGLHE
jgi:hypothetical protein